MTITENYYFSLHFFGHFWALCKNESIMNFPLFSSQKNLVSWPNFNANLIPCASYITISGLTSLISRVIKGDFFWINSLFRIFNYIFSKVSLLRPLNHKDTDKSWLFELPWQHSYFHSTVLHHFDWHFLWFEAHSKNLLVLCWLVCSVVRRSCDMSRSRHNPCSKSRHTLHIIFIPTLCLACPSDHDHHDRNWNEKMLFAFRTTIFIPTFILIITDHHWHISRCLSSNLSIHIQHRVCMHYVSLFTFQIAILLSTEEWKEKHFK